VEDTAFYRCFPLASVNEVGGAPGRTLLTVDAFHAWAGERQQTFPHGLSATATHDTKRGEDVRARLSVLSELPEAFADAIDRWQADNAPHRTNIGGTDVPDPSDEHFIYQTLLGVWTPGGAAADPVLLERLQAYMTKATREAKRHTSWISPNEPYEFAIAAFVDAIVDPLRSRAFLQDFEALWARIVRPGYWNSLSRTAIKLAAPGVPDLYQGTELWDLSLVDPDNRRPVDFDHRRTLLAELDREAEADGPALAARLVGAPEDGRIKLFVTSRGLRLRRARRELFHSGQYLACQTTGLHSQHLIAFVRLHESAALLTVAPRLTLRLGAETVPPIGEALWGDTRIVLPPEVRQVRFRDALVSRTLIPTEGPEGRSLAASQVLEHLPIAMLEGR